MLFYQAAILSGTLVLIIFYVLSYFATRGSLFRTWLWDTLGEMAKRAVTNTQEMKMVHDTKSKLKKGFHHQDAGFSRASLAIPLKSFKIAYEYYDYVVLVWVWLEDGA